MSEMQVQLKPPRAAFAAALAMLVGGCAPQDKVTTQLPSMQPVETVGLAGSSWQMVEFRSNDDSQRPVRPTDPARFRLDLNADGSVALGLECNRGMGIWSASDGGRATSGQLSFGPMAVTRAMCTEPAVADRPERDLPMIRGYLVRDNRLYLSLMADAGTWEFAPIPR